MKRLLMLLPLASLVLAASTPMLAQTQKDAHIGTWKLNVAKSKFNPGPGYNNPDGSTQKYGFTVKYDNKDYPVIGKDPGGADTLAVRLVDPYHIESTSKKGREVLYTSKVAVSLNGETMTITTKGKNADGEPFDNVQVYDRQ